MSAADMQKWQDTHAKLLQSIDRKLGSIANGIGCLIFLAFLALLVLSRFFRY